MAESRRDQNSIPSLLGASNVDGQTPVTVYVDPITHELLVKSTAAAQTDGSQKTQTTDQYNTNDIEEASATITYIGTENKDGAWYIKKIDTSTGTVFSHATIVNNTLISTYSDAWTGRGTLTYSDYSGAF